MFLVYRVGDVSHHSNADFHGFRPGLLDRDDAVLVVASPRACGCARGGRRGRAADRRGNRAVLRVRLLGLRTAWPRHAPAARPSEEARSSRALSDCAESDVLERCLCDARRSGSVSFHGCGGFGGGFFRGRESVRPFRRGAGAQGEIRR